jgi:hypothetical protein
VKRICMVALMTGLFQQSLIYAKPHLINYDLYYYVGEPKVREFPTYLKYLHLFSVPVVTKMDFLVRQPLTTYLGDYFYPPDAFLPRNFVNIQTDSWTSPSDSLDLFNFIRDITKINESRVILSLTKYVYDFPKGARREAYTMLSDADTIYVISGWLDKFLSFYRVVPGDKRLTIPELMKELEKITPLSKEIDQKKFRTESDSVNYLIEYVDKVKMFRVRNYLMKATLPPDPTNSPESYHNLIEVTKFYDKEAIP